MTALRALAAALAVATALAFRPAAVPRAAGARAAGRLWAEKEKPSLAPEAATLGFSSKDMQSMIDSVEKKEEAMGRPRPLPPTPEELAASGTDMLSQKPAVSTPTGEAAAEPAAAAEPTAAATAAAAVVAGGEEGAAVEDEEDEFAGMTPAERREEEERRRIQRLKDAEKFMRKATGNMVCVNCGWVYNPSSGDGKTVPPNTAFESLPEKWRCPQCYTTKSGFKEQTLLIAGFEENQQFGLGTNSLTGGQKAGLIFGGIALGAIFLLSGYAMN
mmetsp:Transcript_4864/g.16310  ORF Transcript_4864/g.16310 Transcript_4864/m.16310 type:complete len:273 (-) Transcript_4864:71-889(-)|eukprot:CAMPEP_0198433858 /NCGR_PEP_ID=MMETSP1452-20131203/28834_1 /TAXON_ID=1181717 /ORGANISM="Synchroma pusillum, Strain CCMP3072" /LENGTH=272 /DNA_ID=CAMNT_0044154355 /DNA_START=16 /DNA_END=834 /DNA_ORIENTATION=-